MNTIQLFTFLLIAYNDPTHSVAKPNLTQAQCVGEMRSMQRLARSGAIDVDPDDNLHSLCVPQVGSGR